MQSMHVVQSLFSTLSLTLKKNILILSYKILSLINSMKKLQEKIVRQELKSSRIVNKFKVNTNKLLAKDNLM